MFIFSLIAPPTTFSYSCLLVFLSFFFSLSLSLCFCLGVSVCLSFVPVPSDSLGEQAVGTAKFQSGAWAH